jgi:hypothetical protein
MTFLKIAALLTFSYAFRPPASLTPEGSFTLSPESFVFRVVKEPDYMYF